MPVLLFRVGRVDALSGGGLLSFLDPPARENMDGICRDGGRKPIQETVCDSVS